MKKKVTCYIFSLIYCLVLEYFIALGEKYSNAVETELRTDRKKTSFDF